jgi:NAD(P)-dependent dehydrogenase (short-subunit alcohol dehydrogenase family)
MTIVRELENKVAIVLGASAEGGTGWAVAEHLSAAGAEVIVAARREAPLRALAARIGGIAVRCDAAREEQIAALAGVVKEQFGGIDIAINCAASPVLGLIGESKLASLQRSLDVNFLAHVVFVREIAAIMRDGGSITLFSTSSAAQPLLGFFPYACAKAATDCLVRYAALEYGGRGIRVNSILPGPIKTEMAQHIFAVPGAEQVFEREIPLGRVGVPEDFARMAVMLSGPHYLSGVNLPVSGGMQLTRAPRQDELPTRTMG